MKILTSIQNERIKRAHKLINSRASRKDTGLVFLEGVRLVEECLKNRDFFDLEVFVDASKLTKTFISLIDRLDDSVVVTYVDSNLAKKISSTKTSQGIAAVGRFERKLPRGRDLHFAVAIDGIQDPGNLGAVIRSAAAFSVDRIYLSSGCADPYSPKCIRGAMGAQFRLAIDEGVDIEEVVEEFKGTSFAATVSEGLALEDCSFVSPTLLIVGAEGNGVRPSLMSSVDKRISIAMGNGIESLNVACATTLLCYRISQVKMSQK